MINKSVNLLIFVVLLAACSPKKGDETSSLNNSKAGDENQYIELIRNDDEHKVDVFANGEIFTSYLYADTFKKPVLYPLKTADGTIITRGFPLNPRPGERSDHPHHVGLWFNYGDVNGLDFWNNSGDRPAEKAADYGTIRHRNVDNISSGGDRGELSVTMEWVDHEEKVLLKENTTFFFRATDNRRVIDRITKLTALDEEVNMKDNKEGMLGIRMTHELEHPDETEGATGMYRSSEGLEGMKVWGTRGKWMNLSGQVGDENISVAILDHPDNVGYPTYWHARGYGLFAANPLGQKALSDGKDELNFRLAAGESVTFKYRIIVYSGEKVSDEQVNSYWEEFAR